MGYHAGDPQRVDEVEGGVCPNGTKAPTKAMKQRAGRRPDMAARERGREERFEEWGRCRSGAPGLFSKHLATVHGSSQGPITIKEEVCIVNEAAKTRG